MIDDLKPVSRQTRLSKIIYVVLLIAGGVAVAPMTARLPRGRCTECFPYLATLSENFDAVTPPALPVGWLATNALGPPPLWITSDNGVPTPPSDTPPNAVFINDPAVLSDKRLDSFSFFFSSSAVRDSHSGTTSIWKLLMLIIMLASTAACSSSAPTGVTPSTKFPTALF